MVKQVRLSDDDISIIVDALDVAAGNLRDDIADEPKPDTMYKDLGALVAIGHLLGRFAVIRNHDKATG